MQSNGHSEVVFVIEDDPDGGFVAHALGHSIVTQADDADALNRNVRDAVACHFEDNPPAFVLRRIL